jgi:hypothetical protein
MRVLNLTQFLAQPEGLIFTCGKQWAFNGLMVKGETIVVDGRAVGYWSRDLCWVDGHGMSNDEFDDFNRLDEMIDEGASYPLNENHAKDTPVDPSVIFLVYEDDDLRTLAALANDAIGKLSA